MTPQPQRVARNWHEVEDRRREPAIKAEVVKYLISMALAGITAYFAAIYGIKEEVAVLKVRLEYMKEKVDSQTAAIDSLTRAINAHTLSHQQRGLP